MGDYKRLRTGDPCPCCGQPIRTTDPQLLELLTRIAADPLYRAAVCTSWSARTMTGPIKSNNGQVQQVPWPI